ncbi:lactonase family protein [Paenibacillus nasutitermitis]|uniref:Lactonase family protein n=1 Tax=Paenibacillus nasutitermitis TaxID=1652958 RepID=A0A916YJ41_9BACL|nr:lactonase family protein [Paenibacillus nasutitermitis]GGD46739.1 hypothetical protein GCM10010911_00290 [Paenibacillus nasutitermitis]
MNGQTLYIFAGSYAESENSGLYVYRFDETTGKLSLAHEYTGLKNPTFLNVDPANRRLYAISEAADPQGNKTGEAAAFAIDPSTGALNLLNKAPTVNAPTCHIQRDPRDQYLIAASYHGGMIGLVALTADGQVGELVDVKQFEGSGPHPERQDQPHPHSSFFSPDGNYLFVQDLGLDRISSYTLDPAARTLELRQEINLHPGAGPRHLAFRPDGRYAYVINEIDSTITAFTYEAKSGPLSMVETVSTLPDGFQGENSCAEIAVSEDGRFLYGSNRGHDSIVVYAINEETGRLTLVEHTDVQGAHPRHFALTPGGRYLIAANRDTNNIATFRVDRESGKLQYTGCSIEVSKPVCVQPFYF